MRYWSNAVNVAMMRTTSAVIASVGAGRVRSSGSRRASQKNAGADARHMYHTTDPTPRLRRSCVVFAGGERMRGRLPAEGAGNGALISWVIISVAAAITIEVIAIRQNR